MSKKIFSIALAGTLVASIGTTYAFEDMSVHAAQQVNGNDVQVEQLFNASSVLAKQPFKDVTADFWASDSIRWGHENGLLKGYSDGTFKPAGTLTEAEFAAIVSRFYSEIGEKSITGSHWADGVYSTLADYQVPLRGYGNNQIRNSAVERGVIAQVIAHIRGQSNELNNAINWMYDEGITVGKSGSGSRFERFGSNDKLTRAEAVVFFHRLSNLGHDTVKIDPSSTEKEDNEDTGNVATGTNVQGGLQLPSGGSTQGTISGVGSNGTKFIIDDSGIDLNKELEKRKKEINNGEKIDTSYQGENPEKLKGYTPDKNPILDKVIKPIQDRNIKPIMDPKSNGFALYDNGYHQFYVSETNRYHIFHPEKYEENIRLSAEVIVAMGQYNDVDKLEKAIKEVFNSAEEITLDNGLRIGTSQLGVVVFLK